MSEIQLQRKNELRDFIARPRRSEDKGQNHSRLHLSQGNLCVPSRSASNSRYTKSRLRAGTSCCRSSVVVLETVWTWWGWGPCWNELRAWNIGWGRTIALDQAMHFGVATQSGGGVGAKKVDRVPHVV